MAPNKPAAATTRYSYDVQDHLASVTDAENNVTTYTYSDRDLLTQEVSPVSGTSTHTYDEHGALQTTTDARGIVTTRFVDDLDRVTSVVYSDGTPGTGYAYDVGTFGKGRLSSISHSGQAVAYTYDRFGRQLQDGALGYGYDANGNRTRTTYPNGVAAVYTHDFADRESTLTHEQGGAAQLPAIVTGAAYEPFGPLASLTLGNGLTETRLFEARYFPDRIQVPGRLDWDYTVDAVGNPLQISDLLTPAQSRTNGYQDYQYFLTQGDGPWGTRSWTYDRIGNRLTETRGGVTDTYGYTGGNPKLQTVAQGGGAGTKYFAYDATGNQIQDSRLHSELQLSYDAAGRMTRLEEATTETAAFLLYDGRGYLREARQDLDLCSPMVTQATYSTEGVLLHRAHRNALAPTAAATDETYVFYFAGTPVALLEGVLPAALTRKYLTADYLGTPVLATNGAAVAVWGGGFEPFGADWSGAQGAGVFLRFPGQWVDGGWEGGSLATNLYYNLHRWYSTGTGRYSRPDPFDLAHLPTFYSYAFLNPLRYSDRLGLRPPQARPTPQPKPETQPDCKPIMSPPDLSSWPAALAARATVVFVFFFDPDEAFKEGDTLYEPVPDCQKCKTNDDDHDDRGPCEVQLERCLESPWQPAWNQRLFGPRKDCGACYQECRQHGELWPIYKCPLLKDRPLMYSDELWMQWIRVQKHSVKLLARKDLDGAVELVLGFLEEQSEPALLGEVLLFKSNIEERRGNLAVARQDLLKAHALSNPATYHRYVVELSLAGLSSSAGTREEAKGWYIKAIETVVADPLTSGIAAVTGLLRHAEWGELPPHERDLCERAILQDWSLFSLPGVPNFENLDTTFEAIQKAYSQPLANP